MFPIFCPVTSFSCLLTPVLSSSDKQPQLEEPTESQDTIPAQDIEDEGAPVAQGPDVGADQQELTLLKTLDEPGDGPDVKEEMLPNFELIKMPEAGLLPIKMQILGFLFSTMKDNHRFKPN
ncbi:putative G antigen family E member 3 [Camelus ferus]|uniref:G antigen family E member 3 n=1 Tax=Camelus ferus TaxID=419612 RepID=A0A8B8SL26_CAMFR|nr:putative G antigen family E member 3 [Camelus ferus]